MKDGKFGFGVIGCGVIGPWHAQAIAAHPRAKVVAACDIIPERVQQFCEQYGEKATPYLHYTELVRDPQVDMVCICTPSGLHGEMAIAAARAGKHILCEKPMEIKLDRIDQMQETAIKNNVVLAGIFQRRTYATSRKVKTALDNHVLGKMVLGDAYLKYYRSQAYYNSAGWRGTWELDGGGALMNQGIHGLDLLLWLMGDVASVYAHCGTFVRNIAVEDTAIALLEYKNGALGVIQGTTSVNPGDATRVELNGKLGTIVLQESEILRWSATTGEDDHAQEQPIEPAEIQPEATADPRNIGILGHIRLVADLIDAVEHKHPPLISAASARKSVELILAIYESARLKKAVQLPL
ncbi:Gfo/Idh/MocA family oxidoreductase [candidate division KSB1 bacterium]|nr:Gfo/Idh/MocA family oxidoreductase [candidate division KSB1 bacterium]